MVQDAFNLVFRIYAAFLSEHRTLLVFGFTLSFMFGAYALAGRKATLSRAAISNTLTTLIILALNLLMAPVIHAFSEAVQAQYDRLGIPHVPLSVWEACPWLLVAIIGLIGKDFSDYWVHRFLHTRLAWPIHAVHHSDSHVNGFTTFRVHPIELMLMNVFYIGLLSWLGIPPAMIATAYVFASLHAAYVHFEVDIDHGPFNWLLASPRFHRWHHADLPDAYGKNLANMIPAWDMLFGTYYKAGPCLEKMGAERDGIPATDPARLMLLPFGLWYHQVRAALTKRPPEPTPLRPDGGA